MVSNIFYFYPYLGKWSNLINIFQMGWNHQLDLEDHPRYRKWLITMVIASPLTGVIPLPNGLNCFYMGVTDHLLTRMILQVVNQLVSLNKAGYETIVSQRSTLGAAGGRLTSHNNGSSFCFRKGIWRYVKMWWTYGRIWGKQVEHMEACRNICKNMLGGEAEAYGKN